MPGRMLKTPSSVFISTALRDSSSNTVPGYTTIPGHVIRQHSIVQPTGCRSPVVIVPFTRTA
jgi:hypothetical protein